MLDEVSKHLGVEFSYRLCGTGRQSAHDDNLELGDKTISYTFFPVTHLSWKGIVKRGLRTYSNTLKWADLVIDLGEGDSFTDIYGKGRFTNLAFSKILTRLAGKPLYLFPQTIGPFDHRFARWIGRRLLRKARMVTPRDSLSLRLLRGLDPDRKHQISLDVAFMLPFEQAKPLDDTSSIGINVSGLLWNGGYTGDNMFRLKCNYRDLICDVIESLLQRGSKNVTLIPHVLAGSGHVEDDASANRELRRLFPAVELAPEFRTPMEAKSFISGLDFFTGSRMHACIVVFAVGVPVVPIAYSRKFGGLFADSLDYPYVADLRLENANEVRRKVLDGYDDRNLLRETIEVRLKQILQDHDRFVSALVESFRPLVEQP